MIIMTTITINPDLKYHLDVLKAQMTADNGRFVSFNEVILTLIEQKKEMTEQLKNYANKENEAQNK